MPTDDAWFVVIRAPISGALFPLLNEDGDMAMFTTAQKASEAAETNTCANAWGFSVYRYGAAD